MAEKLTIGQIEHFLDYLRDKGCSAGSLDNYRRALMRLYAYLPEGKEIGADTARAWRDWMDGEGFSASTVDARMSVWNSLMRYAGHKEWQLDEFHREERKSQPELTRAEYLRLLSAAKALEKEKAYLLIKVMGSGGIRVQELPQLTIEAVRQGIVRLEYHNRRQRRIMEIPETLQGELLAYVGREGMQSGPVFTSVGGKPMGRSSIYKSINTISRAAQVAEEKVTPGALWKMYNDTRTVIETSTAILNEQSYQRILAKEQMLVGWNA